MRNMCIALLLCVSPLAVFAKGTDRAVMGNLLEQAKVHLGQLECAEALTNVKLAERLAIISKIPLPYGVSAKQKVGDECMARLLTEMQISEQNLEKEELVRALDSVTKLARLHPEIHIPDEMLVISERATQMRLMQPYYRLRNKQKPHFTL